MFGDILIEMRRDDALLYYREHPDASLDQMTQGFLTLANDKRLGPPGAGVLIHDESGRDWPVGAFVRHEAKTWPGR